MAGDRIPTFDEAIAQLKGAAHISVRALSDDDVDQLLRREAVEHVAGASQ
jgi:hypothetical protein